MPSTSEPLGAVALTLAARALGCRQCGAARLDDLGAIPCATVFAGQALQPTWEGGSLYRCGRCRLVFRHPIRADDEYEQLYARASEAIWMSVDLRADQRLVRERIEAMPGPRKVLDVGCYDGSLLASLVPRFRRHGVEASTAAADRARQRGVTIVAARIAELRSVAESFDVICAVDVIEHVSQPRDFVATLAARLAPGGRLFISTGDADAAAWREAGGLYWYCGFPEHISFVSVAWAERVAGELGLKLVEATRFAYGRLDAQALAKQRRRFRRKLAQARIAAGLRRWLPAAFAPAAARRSLGLPGLFEDHVLLCFERAA